uniref:Red chlorophyll catabolite reductase, chloroplastic-like n=1 Tax=Nelumbo nucifera TaxID=4432 RepID=A0A822Z882_NELNU|nr:TPA_asm: hypothetical protein HUJ06_000814 [Nelumbo nucifera]
MVNFAQRILGPTLGLAPCSSSRSHSLGRTRLRNFPCAVSSTSSSSPMDRQNRRQGFMEFPHLSAPHRDLMIELVSTMETRLGSQLLPDPLPLDVQCYQNAAGTSQGALHIRPGDDTSSVSPLFSRCLFVFCCGTRIILDNVLDYVI